jgi:hypothetical protein
MKNTLKLTKIAAGLIITMIGFTACENTDPSVAKVYVKSVNKQLVEGAQVVIIGDVENATKTVDYVDTSLTNSSGFAEFNMEAYFARAGAGNDVGVFDVIVKKGDDSGEASGFRIRIHNTAVKTVYFD